MIFKKYTSKTRLEEGEYLFLVCGGGVVHGYSAEGTPCFYDYTSLDVEDVRGCCKITVELEEFPE